MNDNYGHYSGRSVICH